MNDADTRAYWWPYLAILLATVVLGAVFYDLDAFEALHEFTRQHEDWELHELIPLALASIFGLIAALIVRSGQLRAQISRRKRLEADASWLAERGCALAQGFHYSEPMPVLSALNFFERNAGRIAAGEPVAVETVSGSKT